MGNVALLIGAVFLFCIIHQGLSQSQSCPTNDGYFPDTQQCDAYFECKDGVSERKLCPDGLVFNDQLTGYPRYPCSYPQDVQCGSRTRTQPAQSNGDCPHQFGYFSSSAAADKCQEYISCVDGIAYAQQCPEGLAFNANASRCDWPDEVPGCDAPRYLKFNCPAASSEDINPRYADPEGDCRKFYVCIENTNPRMLSCGVGLVFNAELGICDETQNVPQCANYYPSEITDAFQKLRSYDNNL